MSEEPLDSDLAALSSQILGDYGIEPPPPPREYDPSLIPDVSLLPKGTLNPALSELKERIDRDVSVFDVYDHFCLPEKTRATPRSGQSDGILFSCPSPHHPDNHPSAWTNLNGLWYCGSCPEKGDIYTIVALNLGLDCRSSDFKDVMLAIADAFNIDYIKSPITGKVLQQPSTASTTSTVNIIDGNIKIDPPPEPKQIEHINWKYLFGKDTFGYSWMEALQLDDLPEEYYAWEALLALGLAAGRDAFTPDAPPIFGNLFVVLFGPTGIGKSRAIRHLETLLEQALPYDHNDPRSKGIFQMPIPGSPEALVDLFAQPIYEDESQKKIVGYGSVRGLISIDEFASMLAKAEMNSRGLKSQMTTLYDTKDRISTYSRGHGNSIAMYPFCSFLSSTQPTAIRASLGYYDLISGYLNRHIFVIGTPKKQYSMNRPTIDLSHAKVNLLNVRSWASMGRQVVADDNAFKVYDEFFHEQVETLDFEQHPLFARVALTMRKLMLILAINDKSEIINVDIVNRSIHLFEYIKSCYEEIGGNVVSSVNNDLGDWLKDYCRDFPLNHGKAGPTFRDLGRHLPKRFDDKQLVEAVKNAETIGIILPLTNKTESGGRPTQRYVYQY